MLFAADDFSRRYFQMHFFLAALRVKNLSTGKFFMLFFSSADFFSKSTFLKSSFWNTIRLSHSLDPDQV